MSTALDPSRLVELFGAESRSELFPITKKWVYFQNASIGPLPEPVESAARSNLLSQASNGTEDYAGWLDQVSRIRQSVAGLLNARASEISFIRNTAEGLARIAFGLPWFEGDNIVTYAHEYPTNVLPWLALSAKGVEVRFARSDDGRLSVDDLRPLVDSRTRLVALSSVQFSNGYRLNLDEIGEYCRARGIMFSIDAIQHLGALPLDVQALPVDFVSAGAHKWLLSPSGAGIFYVREGLIPELGVTEVGYAGTQEYSINDELLDYKLSFKSTAQKFEGGLPAFSNLVGLGAAVGMFQRVGLTAIEEHVLALTDLAAEGLAVQGFDVISPRANELEKSSILSFVHPTLPSQVLKERLRERGISVSVRVVSGRSVCRISPHFYNSETEIAALLDATSEIVEIKAE